MDHEHQDEITLTRGGRKIVLRKRPDYFAVRLKQGRAASTDELQACCGTTHAPVRHVESLAASNLDIFRLDPITPGDLSPSEAGPSVASAMEATVDALRAAPRSDVVTHVYSVDDTAQGVMIPLGTMTLQFRPDVNMADREALLEAHGLEVVEELPFMPNAYVVKLTEASTENPLKIAAKLQVRDELLVAEPDLSFQAALQHVPSDPLYPQQWHLTNHGGGLGLTAGADCNAEGAWDITTGSRDIVVAVIDDGFDLDHPDLSGPNKQVAPRDFSGQDADPRPGGTDDNHGTSCAGVAIAEENGQGVVGLAPGCQFMPIRMAPWLDDGSIRNMFMWAKDHGADVISCSWTAGAFDFPLSAQMNAVLHHVATQGRSNGKGCVTLFAAGNDDRPLDGTHHGQPSIQGFGIHPDVICVGASNSLDKRSSYSNYGPELTLVAPSNGSPGRGIVTTDRRGAPGYASSDYTSSFGGTSSATPLAAGLAALILSVNPDLTSAQVRQIMMDAARKIDEDHGDYVEGHSPLYGHGRIDAEAAVGMAIHPDDENAPRTLSLEHHISQALPDMGLVEDALPFPWNVAVRDLEVSFLIHHTWRGDLRILLVPPNSTGSVLLWDRAGGGADDIEQTLRASTEPDLAPLIGANAQGEWKLQVEDSAQQDVGVVVRWGIAVTY